MRWNKPSEGDTKIVDRFLFLPFRVGNQWRWLEQAQYEMIYTIDEYDCTGYWRTTRWLNDPIDGYQPRNNLKGEPPKEI